jgi:hypothetical protein
MSWLSFPGCAVLAVVFLYEFIAVTPQKISAINVWGTAKCQSPEEVQNHCHAARSGYSWGLINM